MYLFGKSENHIDVYTLNPDKEKIKAYKEKEMASNIPFPEMVYKCTTNDAPLFEIEDILEEEKTNYDEDGFYHIFEADDRKPMGEVCTLINNYLEGYYDDKRVVRLLDENGEVSKYLLIPFCYLVKYYPLFNMKRMEGIILIPKSLYLLQLLLQGKIDALEGENIDELLQLFNLSSNPLEQLNYGDFSNSSMKVMEASNLILQRKKKLTVENK